MRGQQAKTNLQFQVKFKVKLIINYSKVPGEPPLAAPNESGAEFGSRPS